MRERSKLSSHLYIRVDGPLRTALADAAEAQGRSVSDLARRTLRGALVRPVDQIGSAPQGRAAS